MRRLRAALVGCVGCVVLAASAAPAHAEGEIGLSRDGVHWTGSLTRPLFDPAVRWVPGDVRTARFYVRNQAAPGDRGDLGVTVSRVERDALLDTGFLAVSARAGDGPWRVVDRGGRHELVDRDDLATGAPLLVEVRVAMASTAPNRTMVLATDLDLDVTLRDADASPDTDSDDSDDSDDSEDPDDPADGRSLPATGADVPPWLPPLGLALLGSGAFVLVRRRTRDDDDRPAATLSGS